LPSSQDGAEALRKEVVKKVFGRVTQQVSEDNPDQIRKLAAFVKDVFVVEAQSLDPVPKMPHRLHDEDLRNYLLHQIHKWISIRKEELTGTPEFNWLVNEEETYPFLEALATVDADRIVKVLKTDFWNHSPKMSRTFLAMIFNNCFLWGDYERRGCEKRTDAYGMLCAPFVARLVQLSTTTYAQGGARPSDLEGDAELLEIAKSLQMV